MKKSSKAIISVLLCVILTVFSVTGVYAGSLSDKKNSLISSAVPTISSFVNNTIDSLLNAFVKLVPDSVKVKDTSEYVKDTSLKGDTEFLDEPSENARWSLGYSEASILPDDFGTGKYYKGGYNVNMVQTETFDDLKVRVIVLDDGSGRGSVVFAVVDCIGLANTDVKLIRDSLASFAQENNIKSINVSSTHIHSGIDTQGVYTDLFKSIGKNLFASFAGSDKLEPAISQTFLNKIIAETTECTKEAYSSMAQGTLTYSYKSSPEYFRDRTAPDIKIDNIYRLMFTPDNGDNPTIIASMGVHPESIGIGYSEASSDFVYYTEQVLNKAGCNFMFIQGAVGTITESMNASDDGICDNRYDSVVRYGEEIGYILLGMTETQEECEATIVDWDRENKAKDSENYTPWYENWTPSEETVVEPILNIKSEEFLVKSENGVYSALGKVSLADNALYHNSEDDTYYTSTEIGYMELGKNLKIVLSPGETYAELIKGGENMADFPYKCLYEELGTDNVLVFDLMNDAVGYVMPDSYFTYVVVKYSSEDGLELTSAWGLTSLGKHAASQIYGEFYSLYDTVK